MKIPVCVNLKRGDHGMAGVCAALKTHVAKALWCGTGSALMAEHREWTGCAWEQRTRHKSVTNLNAMVSPHAMSTYMPYSLSGRASRYEIKWNPSTICLLPPMWVYVYLSIFQKRPSVNFDTYTSYCLFIRLFHTFLYRYKKH